MTLLATRYARATNWSARLPVAREIFREVSSEQVPSAFPKSEGKNGEATARPPIESASWSSRYEEELQRRSGCFEPDAEEESE